MDKKKINAAQIQPRIIYYDPNPDGMEPRQLEDLSIDVNLTVNRKSRSIIDGGDIRTSLGKIGGISFLEGTEYGHNPDGTKSTNIKPDGKVGGNRRSLTTSYTDINTTFNKPATDDLEGFGMTDIQIGFNTSYTPMVTIKFVDVRGGMLSQNIDSKYGLFFELPYPIFSLTVKGYYGKAVKYCLHMTKWNAKLNAETGNFEITANFIGYTYAMLADMLMGYLKAIPKTTIGAEKYNFIKKEYKDSDVNIMTIDEMIEKISKLNENINEFKSNSEEYEKLVATSDSTNIIKAMKQIIADFFIEISGGAKPIASSDVFLVLVDVLDYSAYSGDAWARDRNTTASYTLENPTARRSSSYPTLEDDNNIIEKYEKLLKDKVTELKKVDKVSTPNADLFKVIGSFNVKYDTIEDGITDRFVKNDKYVKGTSEETHISNILLATRNRLTSKSKDKTYRIFDFFRATNEIDRILDEHCDEETKLKEKLRVSLRELVQTDDNFDPSIKNLIRIITIHCEVFLDTIMEVAHLAEKPSNKLRTKALLKLAPKELDRDPDDPIYAFPEYNKEGIETWIGTDEKTINSDNVDEVAFVEDMINALIETKQADINIDILARARALDWFAMNPIDTTINNSIGFRGMYSNPYNMLTILNQDEVLRQYMYRSFLYLGVGNVAVNDDLLREMAKFEAANIFFGITEPEIKDGLNVFFGNGGSAIRDHFINGSAKIDNRNGKKEAIPYMFETEDYYVYDYLSDRANGTSRSYIPIDGDWDGQAFFKGNKLKNNTELSTQLASRLFVGNYVNSPANKPYDGAKYVTIMPANKYNDLKFSQPKTLTPRATEDYKTAHEEKRPAQNEIENSLGTHTKIENLNPLDSKFGVPEYFQIKAGGGNGSADLSDLKKNGANTNVTPAFYIDSPRGSGLAKLADKSVTEVGKNVSLVNGALSSSPQGLVVPNIEFGWTTRFDTTSSANMRYSSLFGSPLYYAQNASVEPLVSKAYMFINTFAVRGTKPTTALQEDNTLFGAVNATKTISGMFSTNASFILTPTMWNYWIGSLLWRDQYFEKHGIDPIVTEAVNGTDPINILPEITVYPTTKELFYSLSRADESAKCPMFLTGPTSDLEPVWYKPVDTTLLNLPEQAKDEFIKLFTDWATDANGFVELDSNLSIFDDDIVPPSSGQTANLTDWITTTEAHYVDSQLPNGETPSGYLSNATLSTIKNSENYMYGKTVSYASDISVKKSRVNLSYVHPAYYDLPLSLDTEVNTDLVDLMMSQSVIANYSPHTFRKTTVSGATDYIYTDKTVANNYYDAVADEYVKLYKDNQSETEKDAITTAVFSSIDSDKIKLNVYRHLASINNKWVGTYNEGGSTFFPCGRNGSDNLLAKHDGRSKERLIDSFRFVDKSFSSLGDDFILNPKIISNLIKSNYNQSFFNYIDKILADNNFQFIPLPTYVNINTGEGIEQMFKPYTYNEVIKDSSNLTVGPSFVCVYVGQTSTHLDMGKGSHKNDGVGMRVEDAETRKYGKFDKVPELERGDMYVPVFGVNYAQQNQSYFKSVTLDQSEFTETEESLTIIDDLSKSGNKNKATYVGQNLFNIYQTRAYTAKVEAMGMPLVQPMMYFQLNNIPMFHGAYLIINTSHSIQPNTMSTTFDGVRIKDVNPPIYDDAFEIMELVGDVDNCGAGLKYSGEITNNKDGVVVDGDGKRRALPIYDDDPATQAYYSFGYKTGYSKEGYKGTSDFTRPSNTSGSTGALTYNELFDRVSKLTGVPANTLKVMSVVESIAGKNKGPGINKPTAGGFVGLMQFQYKAAADVRNKLNTAVFISSNSDLNYAAAVDYTKKEILTPKGKWSSEPDKNNPTNNSYFDDYINALAAAYYALKYVNSTPSSLGLKLAPRIYLTHQQGPSGYLNIRNHPDSKVNSNALNNTPPYQFPADKAERYNQEWLAAWTGRIDSVSQSIDPTFKSSNNDNFHNANELRSTLENLSKDGKSSYTEKGNALTSSGEDIQEDTEKLGSAIFSKIKELYPEINVIVSAGNDSGHSGRSRHASGKAIDFTVRGADNRKIVQMGEYKKLGAFAPPAKNDYTAQQRVIIDNVLAIIQGYTAGDGYPNIGYLDEYTLGSESASGPHFHISYLLGGGTESDTEQALSKTRAQANEIDTFNV